ncbi:HAD family hydrolase [Actinotalea sp.]|uniref:HAD family hydrolase n=1 Tax=Actinotalea sp. TaxID=1872145 RepID=UPI00356A0BC4
MEWSTFGAVLLDLDGVLTPTVEIHQRAWEEAFTAFFSAHGITPAYTADDYLRHVDGRPRDDGIRTCLASRGVVLPDGDPDDAPGQATVAGLGNAKNARVAELLAEGVEAYPGSLLLLDHLATLGMPLAVVSSSRNTRAVLRSAGLADRFGAVVDGVVAAREGLGGKPAPDTFLRAAALLGVPPDRAVVVEDAVSGVAAGAAGDFGLVIGVDRGAGEPALTAAGADLVVTDLSELVTS